MIISLLIIAAYLLGSIPSAVWVGRRFYGIDVREHGSHNAGTTNTLRVLGRKAALVVFAIDLLKGFAAVKLFLLVPSLSEQPAFWLKLGLTAAAVAGHIFPVFARFRGGKGVATLAGAMLAINFPAVAICLGVFVIVLAVTHYVSVSSMTAGVLLPVVMWLVCRVKWPDVAFEEAMFGCMVAVLIVFMHRNNIRRLRAGEESKIYLSHRKRE